MKVNEIFYSIQGEGAYAGTPSVFIRLSGCNLKCPFCDTEHESGVEMTDEEIISEVNKYPTRHVVITGGEPSLFITDELVNRLKACKGHFVHIETNGTRELSNAVDWITCSPKFEYNENASVVLRRINELKVVYDGTNDMQKYEQIKADHYYLQPCDTGDKVRNTEILLKTIDYVKQNPKWRISLQTHKILNVR